MAIILEVSSIVTKQRQASDDQMTIYKYYFTNTVINRAHHDIISITKTMSNKLTNNGGAHNNQLTVKQTDRRSINQMTKY